MNGHAKIVALRTKWPRGLAWRKIIAKNARNLTLIFKRTLKASKRSISPRDEQSNLNKLDLCSLKNGNFFFIQISQILVAFRIYV